MTMFEQEVKTVLCTGFSLTEREADIMISDSKDDMPGIWEDDDLDPEAVAEIIVDAAD